jgi:hypothetical protein
MKNQLLEFEKCFEENDEKKQVQILDNWLKMDSSHDEETVKQWNQLFSKKKFLSESKKHILKLYYNDEYNDYPNTAKVIVHQLNTHMLHKFYLDEIFEIFKNYRDSSSKQKFEILFMTLKSYANVINLPDTPQRTCDFFNDAYQYAMELVQTPKGYSNALSYLKDTIKKNNEDYLFSNKIAKPYIVNILNNFKTHPSKSLSNWIYKVKQTNTLNYLFNLGYDKVLENNPNQTIEHLTSLMKNSYFSQFDTILNHIKLTHASYQILMKNLNELLDYTGHIGVVKKEKIENSIIFIEKKIIEQEMSQNSAQLNTLNIKENKKIKL